MRIHESIGMVLVDYIHFKKLKLFYRKEVKRDDNLKSYKKESSYV